MVVDEVTYQLVGEGVHGRVGLVQFEPNAYLIRIETVSYDAAVYVDRRTSSLWTHVPFGNGYSFTCRTHGEYSTDGAVEEALRAIEAPEVVTDVTALMRRLRMAAVAKGLASALRAAHAA